MISYDNVGGSFILSGDLRDPAYYSKVIEAVCFDDMAANTCVTIVGVNAIRTNSRYSYNIASLDAPRIDGVLLKPSSIGSMGIFANSPGCLYITENILPGNYNDTLYVGKDGLLTNIVPSLVNDDIWYMNVGIKIEDHKFIYNPQLVINIINNPVPTPIPVVIGSDEKVMLSQAMPKFTCFNIGSDGKAYTVTANNATLFMIDGLTLESGGIDQQISVARLKNYYYETGFSFTDSKIYWLSATGVITDVRPTDTTYQVMVGRSIPNSTKFIFDPQVPIKLA